jgi:hypothetical protein
MENAYNHVENALYAEQQKVTAHAKELAELREKREVADKIEGTFWDALKLLNLPAIRVENPGSHFIDVINERDTLRAQLETIACQLQDCRNRRDEMRNDNRTLTDSQSMVEHLRLELEAHRNGTVAKEAEDMAADNARLSVELSASQKRVMELEEALQELHDLQNGPPLYKYEKDWFAAMLKTEALLNAARQSPKQEGM